MAAKYFSWILKQLGTLNVYGKEHDEEDKSRLRLYYMDIQFIHLFCRCLEEWVKSDEEEQTKDTLRCMITHLKVIWVEDDDEDNNFKETWPKDILQDFDPLTFGLELKIEQSKLQIEKFCEKLVCSPMQCKSSSLTAPEMISSFITSVNYKLNDFRTSRAAKIVPFKNQIDILEDMTFKMQRVLFHVRGCTDSKELVEYISFVHAFYNNATCLTCLYWVKEVNDQTANELNIALFDMLQNIKSCAAYVTACYIHVLKSNNLLQFNDSVSQGQTLARFVDFFFEHTVLKDDFLILRDWFIFLFTFLADAPHENTQEEEEEEDLIRIQIYALLREDAYLLLPISDSVIMKDDFSKRKMLFSDFMIKIDIITAKIIELYCRPSHSCNRLEVEKMNKIYFASLQRELSVVKTRVRFTQKVLHLYGMEIRFLRSLFFQCFETWDDSDEETRIRLCSVVTSLQNIWGKEYDMGLLSGRLYAICKRPKPDWTHVLDLELKQKIQVTKQEINTWLASWFHCSFHCRPSTSNKIMKFLDSILYNMSEIFSYRACKDAAFKKQTEILEEKLLLLKDLLKLATNCAYSKNLEEFNLLAQVFANNVACLIYHYWAKEANDEIPTETSLMLSNMLQKIKPNTPDVARMYVGTLKAICLQPYDSFLLEQTATSLIDYFFEDLVTPWKNDFQIYRNEVIFYLTFVHHHHIGNVEEIICSQLDVLFSDGVYDLLPFDDMTGDSFKKKVGLSDFLMNIGTENAKIRQIYCKFPDSFMYTFPRIIGQGFLNCLILKLRNLTERMINDQKYVPFAKYNFLTIEDELVSMTPIFNQIMELTDQNDVWLEVVNVAYLADHIISLCLIFYRLIGNYIPYLYDVVDKIKVVRTKYNARCIPHSVGFKSTIIERDWTSEIPVVMVGFEVDEKIIIDNITRGTDSLDIVSIVGMGGLGKTTLAKSVYGSSFVKSHFNINAFTCVSQDHDKRRLLLNLLRDIIGVDDQTSYTMSEDDLSHKLKKCLSRKKYFIVLDDIWNINAWDEVRSSFPDDRNGSRVMFTTRSLEVAKRGQIKCTPHRLRFLSEDDSWNLLQSKLFHNDMPPPPNISSVAKLIAMKCGGLPLAIVVIAGLLARTKRSLWAEISKGYLKPCLLYLGAFPEDRSYTIRHVTLLWIDEGFIKESNTKSLNDVATEYLYELVDRSLVIFDEIATGEMHSIHVHDLIHEFCQKKCRDESFFQLGHGIAASSFLAPLKYNHYRVSVHKLCEPLLTNTRSLLLLPSKFDNYQRISPLSKFRFAHLLSLRNIELKKSDFAHMASLIDLRHVEAEVAFEQDQCIPSSISDLWNLQSLILWCDAEVCVPATLWRMKSLRHVQVSDMKFEVSDELNAFPQLDNVVSFSRPHLSSGKVVEWLLQRLPAVRELDCVLHTEPLDSTEERVETFDFHKKLESLSLYSMRKINCPYLINFPSTLIRLTLERFELSTTTILAITELQCLRMLNLRYVSFPGRTWEMEDVTLPNLKYIKLQSSNIELWTANTDSLPCLEQLLLSNTFLKELPSSFGEISSLKRITARGSGELVRSALRVQEEQMEYGNKIELVM